VSPELRRHFRPLVLGGLALAVSGQYAFVATFQDRLGIFVAFIINLVMSIAFVAMVYQRRDRRLGFSSGVAWCKMLGTIGTNIECHYVCKYIDPELPRLWFLTWIGVATFVFDALYLALLYRERKLVAGA
jgi:hypothetical protein